MTPIPEIDFAALLKRRMGLDPASVGSATIDRAVRLRMTDLALEDRVAYWKRLSSSSEELQNLIEAVVVPETWFFRDPEAFALLVRLVTAEWISARPAGVLRLLSAPCSTGEEPYSMVMALVDGGVPLNRFKVDAIDISAVALAHAREGMFRRNSFRGLDLGFRERFFRHTGGNYSLPKWLKDMVSFQQENLLSADFRLAREPYDMIFCRNLLIYFDLATQQQAIAALRSLLTPTGLLFVGPAETFLASSSGFEPVNQSMAFAFRKTDGSLKPKPALRPRVPNPVAQNKIQAPALLKPVPSAAPPAVADLGKARRLADAGELRQAAELCENRLRQGPSPDAYYLLGLVRDGMGDPRKAAEYYRKAIYLEPDHVEALAHLALLSESQGDMAAAARLRERARRVQQRTGLRSG